MAENGIFKKPAPVVKKAPAPVVKAVPVVVVKKDDDKDGVYNEDDKCPNTPEGASVNTVGCWAFSNAALFDFDKSDINPEAYPMLGEAVKILEKNPSMGVTLQGYTDNVGNEDYNMGLSLRRANAIKAYFIEKGITEAQPTHKSITLCHSWHIVNIVSAVLRDCRKLGHFFSIYFRFFLTFTSYTFDVRFPS